MDVFSGYELTDGDYVKNQTISSTYYEDYGWFGELEEMQPLDGYMLKVANEGTLTYGSNSHQFSVLSSQKKRFKSEVIVNPADFEYSGQVTAAVFVDEANVGSANGELIAWVNGEARGIAKGLYFSPKEHWVYSLMIYSNLADGDTVEFSFYDVSSQEQISFNEQLVFAPDMIIKDAEEPYELRELRANDESLDHLFTQSLTVFPNPASNQLSIRIRTATESIITLELYNIYGQKVKEEYFGIQPAGERIRFWDISTLKPGIYVMSINGVMHECEKLLITK